MQGRGGKYAIAGWLVLLTAAQVAAFLVVHRVFVTTMRGQRLDTAALTGNRIGRRHIEGLVDTVLDAVTVASVVIAVVVIGFIALARGRLALAALATILIVGANATTQLLKEVIERPDFGVDGAFTGAGNSLPSGHATVAASVAVALVLVLPTRLRGAAALLGAGYAALVGVATLSESWHRPSDAVAAHLVVGAWAAVVGLILVMLDRDGGEASATHRYALTTLWVVAAGLLFVAVIGLGATLQVLSTPPEWFGRNRLLAAYAGGGAGIAGSAAVMMALVLAGVHRVVPDRCTTG